MLLPLCIDLDGTLIKEDVTWKSVLVFMRKFPLKCGLLLFWLIKGRAYLKSRLGLCVTIDPKTLTYNQALLSLIIKEHHRGRFIALATAADAKTAQIVAAYVGGFDEILATHFHTNLRASKKAEALRERFGEKQFVYIGNSRDDLKVAEVAAAFILISGSHCLRTKARRLIHTKIRCLNFNEEVSAADLQSFL